MPDPFIESIQILSPIASLQCAHAAKPASNAAAALASDAYL